jgi:hypothetical protein
VNVREGPFWKPDREIFHSPSSRLERERKDTDNMHAPDEDASKMVRISSLG